MIGKLRILFWTGIVLLFVPQFGIPQTFKSILTVGLGILVIVLALKLRHGYKKLKFQLRHTEEVTTQQDIIHG